MQILPVPRDLVSMNPERRDKSGSTSNFQLIKRRFEFCDFVKKGLCQINLPLKSDEQLDVLKELSSKSVVRTTLQGLIHVVQKGS